MVRKIVITGGPCAGKTTGMTWIQKSFEKMGYTVLFMSEPATEMKTAGITPARCTSSMAYQLFQMKLQLEKEKVFDAAARDILKKMETEQVSRLPLRRRRKTAAGPRSSSSATGAFLTTGPT